MTCVWEPDPACLGDSWDALEPEQQERSLRFRPRGARDVSLMRPTVDDVVRALLGHLVWPAVADAHAPPIGRGATTERVPLP